MAPPQRIISVRVPKDLHQQLKVVAAARRQTPSELVRQMVEREMALLGSGPPRGGHPEKAATAHPEVLGRLAHAAIFAELSLEQFTASEDAKLTQQLHDRAAAKVAELLGPAAPPTTEQGDQQLRDEQLAIAKKFATG